MTVLYFVLLVAIFVVMAIIMVLAGRALVLSLKELASAKKIAARIQKIKKNKMPGQPPNDPPPVRKSEEDNSYLNQQHFDMH